jgi:hypothetical protein
MHVVNGEYRCLECGTVLDIPHDKPTRFTIHAASGNPDVRVLISGGKEIHRCEFAPR